MFYLKLSLVVCVLALTCGCTILSHLDELNKMGEFSREKDNQAKIVKLADEHYDALVAAIKSNQLKSFSTQADFRTNFGEPISIKEVEVDGQKQERWLYRHAILKGSKDRTYLYFDIQGHYLRCEQENIQL